jgi:catechol 2,3-dioxygenase-like lactoylglutathione lyase family enzyme
MPSGIVKAIVLVDDLDATVRFLTEIVGVTPVTFFESTAEQASAGLGWPQGKGATQGAIVGSRQGLLELVEIPEALRGDLQPGVAGLSFGSRDVAAGAAAAREAGFDAEDPFQIIGVDGGLSTISRVAVGGVPFELINFGTPLARSE